MLTIAPKDRIAIYFFYDSQGIADRYVIQFLEGLKSVAARLLVVVNGDLCDKSAAEISAVAEEIYYRPNVGYDAWAYKDAFDHIGWDELLKYKEVVYCNATIFGPIYPFTEMFEQMAQKEDLDFWGITFHPDLITKDTLNPLGYIPEHIQHYFVVYRQKFTAAPELKAYWDNLPPISSYEETVGLHETVFTKHFADLGFKWDTFIRYTEVEESTNYMLMYDPLRAVTKYRSPVIKRKLFFLDEDITLTNSIGERISGLLQHLQEHRLYNTDLIYENIIRTSHQADFIAAFNLRFVVPEKVRLSEKTEDKYGKRAALVMLLDRTEESREKAEAIETDLPLGTDIIRLTDVAENSAEFFRALKTACAEHDYVCIWNGRTVAEQKFSTAGRSSTQTQTQALLATKQSVMNTIDVFDGNPFLGLLSPMPPLINRPDAFWADRWQGTFRDLCKWKEKLGFATPLNMKKNLATPYDSSCWLRSSAILPLLTDDAVQSELSDAQIPVIRRILSLAVQNAGYAPGYITTDLLVGHQLSALTCYAEVLADKAER